LQQCTEGVQQPRSYEAEIKVCTVSKFKQHIIAIGLTDHVRQDKRAAIIPMVDDALIVQSRPAMRAGWLHTSRTTIQMGLFGLDQPLDKALC
jgi:hypothetical protein